MCDGPRGAMLRAAADFRVAGGNSRGGRGQRVHEGEDAREGGGVLVDDVVSEV